VATRTVVLSVVSRTDCLPWPVSFCSDRRCLIRTLADLPHNEPIIQSASKPRVATVRFFVRLERPFLRSLIAGHVASFFDSPLFDPPEAWSTPLGRPSSRQASRGPGAQERSRDETARGARLRASLDGSEHHDTP
jgi:hypothetical protein